jgi:hypothetical protein
VKDIINKEDNVTGVTTLRVEEGLRAFPEGYDWFLATSQLW